MGRRASMLALYRARKVGRLCVDCGAGLQEGDKLRCVECHAINLRCAAAYRATAAARKADAARTRRRYAARKAAGACVNCRAPTEGGKARCPRCLAEHAVWQARYLDAKEGK